MSIHPMKPSAKRHGEYWLPVVTVCLPDGSKIRHVGDSSCPQLYKKDALKHAQCAISESRECGYVVLF